MQQRCKEAEASLAEMEEQRRQSEAQLQALGHKMTQAQQAHEEGKRQAAESKQAAEAERTRLDEVPPHSACDHTAPPCEPVSFTRQMTTHGHAPMESL